MSRRTLSGLVAVSLVALMLAGCAPAATPTPTPRPAQPTAAQPTAVPEEPGGDFMKQLRADGYIGPPLTTDNITLTIMRTTRQDYEEALYERWNAEFKAAFPNITLVEEKIPFGDLFQKVQVIIAGGDPPDMMLVDGPMIKSYCYFDILMPLNDHVSQDVFDDYVPATLEEHSCDGKVYAFPQQQSACAIFANVDMFQEAGLEVPPETDDLWEGKTWEWYMEAWKKLTKDPSGTGSPDVWGMAPSEFGPGGVGSNYYLEGMYIRGKGDPEAAKDSSEYKTWAAISADGTEVKGYFDSPEAIEGMKFYQSIFQVEKVSPTAGMPNAFPDQRAATVLGTDSWVGRIANANPDVNFVASPIPHYEDGVPFTHGGSTTITVPKGSKHPNEAFALAMYWMTFAHRVEFAEVTNALPARLSVFDAVESYKSYPNTMFASTTMNWAQPRPPGPGYNQYQYVADQAIKDIGLGADVASTLHAAADELHEYLAQFK